MQNLEHVRFPEEAGVSSQGILNYIAAREEAGLEHHAILGDEAGRGIVMLTAA